MKRVPIKERQRRISEGLRLAWRRRAMWNHLLDEMAAEIETVKADSRLIVVDFAERGDVCEFLIKSFPAISILYSNQRMTEKQDKQFSASPRDIYYLDRVKRLDLQKARPFSLPSDVFLERLGGRRFDVAVNRYPFTNDTDAEDWIALFEPVVTGKMFLNVNGRLKVLAGGLPIPERRPLPAFAQMEGVTVEGKLPDVNKIDKYERRA